MAAKTQNLSLKHKLRILRVLQLSYTFYWINIIYLNEDNVNKSGSSHSEWSGKGDAEEVYTHPIATVMKTHTVYLYATLNMQTFITTPAL